MSEHTSTSSDKESFFEDLLVKDTDSFKCLAQIFLSRSSIFEHPLYNFPSLEDPDLDAAINYKEPPQEFDDYGVDNYLRLCKKFQICALKRVIQSLPTNTLNLKYYGLREKQVEAIMDSLSKNKFVLTCILEDSWLTPRSVEHVTNMLMQNNKLMALSLRECRIKPEGAEVVNQALLTTNTLYILDLSYNRLESLGISYLVEGLIMNKSIRILNLSNNNLGDETCQYLSEILAGNDVLEDLDLSWNSFYSGIGNNVLFAGFRKNYSIKKLSLAWNGIATAAASKPIAKFLRRKKTFLEYFDISGNRLTDESLTSICNGVRRCKKLIILKMGFNLIKEDEAISIIRLFNTIKTLQELYMENTIVNKEFLGLWSQLSTTGKKVVFEGALREYEFKPVDKKLVVLNRLKYIGKKPKLKSRRVDLGKFVFSLPDELILQQDLFKALKQFKLKADKELQLFFYNQFKSSTTKFDCVKLKDCYLKYFPDAALPFGVSVSQLRLQLSRQVLKYKTHEEQVEAYLKKVHDGSEEEMLI
ncbi:hypothetical protein FQA39_LY08296 [Lamprigera yunnana]|nr:hypothetical protein FQA39_LY08296 [Lamprigera yunnana]